MALIQSTAIPSGATDYELEQSLRFDDDDSAYLSRTPASAGNQKTWTWSGWVKRGNLDTEQVIFGGGTSGTNNCLIRFNSDNTLRFHNYASSFQWNLTTTAVYRDTSSWYNIIAVADTSNGTSGNRVRLYVNGQRITAFGTETYPSQNYDGLINSSIEHTLAKYPSASSYQDGYLAEVNFIDGAAKAPADFGETGTYGEWKPIEYSGTYGTNGFYLPFKQDYTVEGFSTVTYRGNGATNHYIGGTGFQPDLIWLKSRTDGSDDHQLYDSIRGAAPTLYPSDTYAENPGTSLLSFEADGFTVGNDTGINGSGESNVAWNWDMGGSNATNTDGSITATVRANTTYGQSIVTYDGNNGGTVGHGLDSAPNMLIWKQRDGTDAWMVWHSGYGNNGFQQLNTTAAAVGEYSWFMGSTAPSSTLVTMGNGGTVNASGNSYVMYAFHDVTGYSKFGSYTGNASTNAVTTGFAPAFVMLKDTTGSGHSWEMHDSVRGADFGLLANESDAENTSGTDVIDFTDTGFTLKNSNGNLNGSGNTYIYMAFADKREYAYWLDQSGNNNDWTSNNLTESDISVDSPTNNFATLNPLDNAASFTLSEGNLKSAVTGVNNLSPATFGMTSGKWYFEYYLVSGSDDVFGVSQQGKTNWNSDTGTWVLRSGSGTGALSWNRDTSTGYDMNYVNDFTNADVVSVAVDMDSGKIWFAINGTWNPDASNNTPNPASGTYPRYSNLSGTIVPVVSQSIGSGASTWVANFGQDSSFAGNKTAQGNQDGNDIGDFYYTPPTGFLALCTKNLPDVDVVPSEHFNTVLWTGDGTDDRSITGVGFQPDWVWGKGRSNGGSHRIADAVRGATKLLMADDTGAEYTSNAVKTFISDGFTTSRTGGNLNDNNWTFVAWNWKANGSGSSNTDGSSNSTVSANTDAGFSIVSYTGQSGAQTIGHGLSKTPEMIILKNRSDADEWLVYYGYKDNYLRLDTNAAEGDNTFWNDTAPTPSVFSVGDSRPSNSGHGSNYIAYCFHSVDGYSKADGFYIGNASTDGVFNYCGFSPKWIMIKRKNAVNNWYIYDTARTANNPNGTVLLADSSNAEATQTYFQIDILSNGWKARASDGAINTSGEYIYLAFAETPFKYSNAR